MSEKVQEAATGNAELPPLAQHDSSVLDLAFAMDCTGSMGSYIHSAQQNIRTIVEEIVSAEKSDVHLALVEYRDHPPQDTSFVTRVNDFTASVSKMKKNLDACSANGGGDCPEAVADALHQVSKLTWRKEATKICVFIADAPPHGLGNSGDGFPNGCPDGLDPMEITQKLAQMGVTIYMVGCEPSIKPYKDFFMALAHTTGGQYVPLGNAQLLSKVIIGGAQEEISLDRLINEAEAEVQEDVMAAGGWGAVGEDFLSERIMDKMNSKRGGVQVQQLCMGSKALPAASTKAQKWSTFSKLSDVRTEYVADVAESTPTREMRLRTESPPGRSRMSKKAGSKKSTSFMSKFSRGKKAEAEEEVVQCDDATMRYAPLMGAPAMLGSGELELDDSVDDSVDERSPSAAGGYEVASKTNLDMVQASRMMKKMKNRNT